MSQSQQPFVRSFIAVDFRGIQQTSKERTSLGVAGAAGVAVFASLSEGLPEPVEREREREMDTELRAQLAPAATAIDIGGEAARAAYAYAALGGLVRLAAVAGQDAAGDLLLRWLAEREVDVSAVARQGTTDVSLHLGATGFQPLTATGAALAPAAPEKVVGDRGSSLLLAGYPFVGSLRGAPAVALFERARDAGVRTVLSLAPVALGGQGKPLVPADLESLLPFVDLICGGPSELRRATRRGDSQEAARVLIDAGATSVLAKRGTDGAAVFRRGPAALEREDTSTPTAAATLASAGVDPLRRAATFGALYDAAYLLGVALNDGSPVRFASAAATRAAVSPSGILGM
jgi:sugar/nucleoside kinase (ribokinase family)